ncbi:gag protein [Purpureocillium lilacinum]|uniref:Gag protein n=1 Tax=Purpureocillium lilacinum TaxID=33203 RepID=A0A179EWR4_PURLI|nr:gag protein [Purpureocillium lilacinum]
MSNNNPSSQKVLLQTFEDWGRWDEEFQTKATSLQLWDFIDPQSDETPMDKPERPNVGDYYRRIPPRTSDPESQAGRQTRHSGQSSQTQRQSSPSEPIISLPEATYTNLRARSVAELTTDDKSTFMFEWRVYEQDYREYKEQEARCEKLKAWVTDTVDYGLRQSSCLPMWDLRTWYTNLKTSMGATEREQQTAARRKYQAATTPLTKFPKDFAAWITAWEMATNHALVRKTGGVEDPNVWFEDLTKAIQPILPSWVAIYAGIYKEKLEEKTLAIGEVAKDLRKEAERRNLLGSREKNVKVTRGVFGPTFAGEPAPTTQQDEEQEAGAFQQSQGSSSGQKRKANAATTTRRKRAATVTEITKTCGACDGNHQLANCFYAFPENAPDFFKGRKVKRDAFEHRLRTDPTLKDEIYRIKKAAQFEEPA